jgi:hypothetical protein
MIVKYALVRRRFYTSVCLTIVSVLLDHAAVPHDVCRHTVFSLMQAVVWSETFQLDLQQCALQVFRNRISNVMALQGCMTQNHSAAEPVGACPNSPLLALSVFCGVDDPCCTAKKTNQLEGNAH